MSTQKDKKVEMMMMMRSSRATLGVMMIAVVAVLLCDAAAKEEAAYPSNDASSMGTTGGGAAAADIPMPEVDIETVPSQLMKLSELSDAEPGTGVTRLIFTEKDVLGRNYVKSLMRDAGEGGGGREGEGRPLERHSLRVKTLQRRQSAL